MAINYRPDFDYSRLAINTQGIVLDQPKEKQYRAMYPGIDNWYNAVIEMDTIYILTEGYAHDLLVQKKHIATNVMTYFTDQETVKPFIKDSLFAANQLHQALQFAPKEAGIAPYDFPFTVHDSGRPSQKNTGEPVICKKGQLILVYNRYLECFRIDYKKMAEIYSTNQFIAAITASVNNPQWGVGGGILGFNCFLTELYNNGVLVYCQSASVTADPKTVLLDENRYAIMKLCQRQNCKSLVNGLQRI